MSDARHRRHDRQRGRRHRRQARARAGHRRLPDHAAVARRRAALGKWVESGELPAEFVAVESRALGAHRLHRRLDRRRPRLHRHERQRPRLHDRAGLVGGRARGCRSSCASRTARWPRRGTCSTTSRTRCRVRDAGWVQLYCRDNQEILDTTVQAFRIAEQLNVPVMVCYDGFLLSHTVMPVDVPDAEDGRRVPAAARRRRCRSSTRPTRATSARSTLADPRADAEGVLRHGYMEFRALHHARAARRARGRSPRWTPSAARPPAARGAASPGSTCSTTPRSCSSRPARSARSSRSWPSAARRGRARPACSASALPAVPGRGAARQARGPRARARVRQGAELRLRGPDLRRPARPRCCGVAGRAAGLRRDLRPRRARRRRPTQLADAAARALADHDAGVRDRADRVDQPAARRGRAMTRIIDLPDARATCSPGNRACAGCGIGIGLRAITKALDGQMVHDRARRAA